MPEQMLIFDNSPNEPEKPEKSKESEKFKNSNESPTLRHNEIPASLNAQVVPNESTSPNEKTELNESTSSNAQAALNESLSPNAQTLCSIEETSPDENPQRSSAYSQLTGRLPKEEIPRILALRDLLNYLNRRYYEESVSEITDNEFDFLMKELSELEARRPEIDSSSSPTQRVGGNVVDSLKEVRHKVVMLSIENVYSPEGVLKFGDNVYQKFPVGTQIQWILELKIDGVAISIHYRHGKLVQAVTRGDGEKGNDVTHNVRTIRDVPLELKFTDPRYPIPEEVEIRGEVYLTNQGLSLLNERQKSHGKELYANPRNAASGSILLKDPKLCAQRPLRMFCHSVGQTDALPCRTHSEFLEAVQSWGLVPTPNIQHFSDIKDAIAYCEQNLESLFNLDFEADGFVLKVDDFNQRKVLGETSKFPRWLIALKFQKYEAVTRLLNIFTQVGKTGVVTPVAELEPVQLAGTTVSRSSLHNASEIRRKDLRIGDWVVVEKAGKIIPHIVRSEIHRRETPLPEYQFPTNCPICDSELIQDDGGVYIRCSNPRCPARWSEKILYFGSRDAMNIKGLGTKLGALLMERGFLNSYADIYRLEDVLTPQIIDSLPRIGSKMTENLCRQIQASKTRGLARLLNALSITHLGKETAEMLAMKFLSMDALQKASRTEIALVDGIGEAIAESVFNFLHSEEGEKSIDELKKAGVLMDFVDENGRLAASNQENAFLPLNGQTVVATGKLKRFTRQQIEGFVKQLGGKPASSVSAKTSFVIAGEDAGSKLTKARELQIDVLSEDEFLEKFNLSEIQPSFAQADSFA